MMPDLGKYAVWVLASYGVALSLIVAITVASLLRARRVRRALAEIEQARSAPQATPDAAPHDGAARGPANTVAEAADG